MRRGLDPELVDSALHSFFKGDGSLQFSGDGAKSRAGSLQGKLPEYGSSSGQGQKGGLGHAYEQDDEQGDALGDQLLAVVRKRLAAMRGLPVETQKRRLTGFIQRRGHSWATAKRLLQLLGLMS